MDSHSGKVAPLTGALADTDRSAPCSLLGAVTGEGVGSEVIPAALTVLDSIASEFDLNFQVRHCRFDGFPPVHEPDAPLPGEVTDFCDSVFAENGAVLCGPVGGRFVYELRRRFDLFCKFVPLKPLRVDPPLGCLPGEHTRDVDVVLVRENVGGAYFGEWSAAGPDGGLAARHTYGYVADEIERILGVACRLAAARGGGLTMVVKRNGVPTISALWEKVLGRLAPEHAVEAQVLDIDHAVYQLIRSPEQFDVLVAPNMFGDILGDCGALLLGARGVSFSGNFGPGGRSVFQTAHGAAFDIAGRGVANPVGQILSLAMMLRERFDAAEAAWRIEEATRRVLAQGYRTPDMAVAGREPVGTHELAERIAGAVSSRGVAAA